MTNPVLHLFLFFSPPAGLAPPYVFDPVTAEVVSDDDTLEVLAFDVDGRMDGALLATPLADYIRIDASFGDGYVSFDLVVTESDATIRNVETDLPKRTAEHRVSTMLRFAATVDGPEQPITERGCMVRFGAIAALCASAIAIPPIWAGATIACTGSVLATYCQCLPLLGYDPCN